MAVLKPRSRLVYFRVSEEEFHEFSEMCQHANARSLSDFARSAMQQMRKRRADEDVLADRLRSFDELIKQVNQKLELIAQLVEMNMQNASQKQESGD